MSIVVIKNCDGTIFYVKFEDFDALTLQLPNRKLILL